MQILYHSLATILASATGGWLHRGSYDHQCRERVAILLSRPFRCRNCSRSHKLALSGILLRHESPRPPHLQSSPDCLRGHVGSVAHKFRSPRHAHHAQVGYCYL